MTDASSDLTREGLQREFQALSKDYGVLLSESNEWERRAEAAESSLAALTARLREYDDLFDWVLGQHPTDEFPPMPEDWPFRKFYWRSHLRERLARISGSRLLGAGRP